ncbi:MAG: carboxypeptidase regulatory-like domain-containing protein [Euryarchaeota archaeon]|nr:carboxypeptidase regulatory-like domain-containing protein [Euryarchaeota archaeon]
MRARWALLLAALVASGCAGERATVSESTAASQATVSDETGGIEGLVVDGEGKPIPGAAVGVQKDLFSAEANSSADGRFVFSSLVPGAYKVFAQKLGFDSYAGKANVTAGLVTPVEVRLTTVEVGPPFPIELTVHQVRTVGVWLQVPQSAAAAKLPTGFRAKPHVLLDPNDQTAEYAVYVTSYKNGTVDNESVGEGFWAFEVLNVDPPTKHASGATVDFILVASYASDPKVQELFAAWNVPAATAQMTLTPGDVGPSTFRATASVKNDKGTYGLTAANTGTTNTAVGSSITVRLFGLVNKDVVNYVDLALGPVEYSIQGAGTVDGAATLAMTTTAPAGESYVQWGPSAKQSFLWQEAKK